MPGDVEAVTTFEVGGTCPNFAHVGSYTINIASWSSTLALGRGGAEARRRLSRSLLSGGISLRLASLVVLAPAAVKRAVHDLLLRRTGERLWLVTSLHGRRARRTFPSTYFAYTCASIVGDAVSRGSLLPGAAGPRARHRNLVNHRDELELQHTTHAGTTAAFWRHLRRGPACPGARATR